MRLFQWTTSSSVYLPEIDDEHRGVCKSAAALYQEIAGSGSIDLKALKTLLAQVEDHFTHEERMMRSVRYPSLDWHRKQHDTVRKNIARLMPRIKSGESPAALELLEQMSGWLKEHTALADRMMASYYRNYARRHPAVA